MITPGNLAILNFKKIFWYLEMTTLILSSASVCHLKSYERQVTEGQEIDRSPFFGIHVSKMQNVFRT